MGHEHIEIIIMNLNGHGCNCHECRNKKKWKKKMQKSHLDLKY